jgi:hypothetical protein
MKGPTLPHPHTPSWPARRQLWSYALKESQETREHVGVRCKVSEGTLTRCCNHVAAGL